MAFSSFATCEELLVLGSHSAPRLPIFSFLVKPKMGRYLHHNYVCAVLNDVFGIQSRGGCARLDRSTLRRRTEGSQYEMLRPGFTRLNFAYFLDDDQAKFVIDAVIMAAENAWKLLPYYKFNPETGEWRHNTESGKLVSNRNAEEGLHSPPQSFEACLEEARKIFANASADCAKVSLPDQAVMFRDVDRLRWFMLPSEALEILQRGSRCEIANDVPFVPKSYESYTPRNWVDFVQEIPSVTTANIVQKAMKTAKAELDPKSKSRENFEDLGRVSNNFDNSPTTRNSLVTDNRRKSSEKIVDRQPISKLISTMSLMDVTREEFNDGVQVTSSSVLELNPDDGENNQEESSLLKFERRDSKRIALVSKENDLRVVRPFVYVREKDLRQFAEYQGLPIIAENCPGCFDAPKERYRIKQMLAQQEVMFPKLFASLLSALHPLMAFGRVGVESKIMGTRFSWKKDGEDA
ncbi:unnamed protein product, partial [Notodromas monacha]